MNTSLTAYTHLESLLLFQSLNVYGLANNAFSHISKLLKSNPCITSDRRFESGRLSPDALRNFCLKLLEEEEHSEQQQDGIQEQDVQNGQLRNSRKRKAPSPAYPTVQEARQKAHLIPRLVQKLYARYRTAITHEIRDDEDKYERLQRELQSIERGERDSDLVDIVQARSSVTRSPSLPRKSPLLQQSAGVSSPSPQPGAREDKPAPALDGPEPARAEPQESQQPSGVPNGQVPTEQVSQDVRLGPPGRVSPSSTSGPQPVQNYQAVAQPVQPSRPSQPVYAQNQVPPPTTSQTDFAQNPVSTANNAPTPLPPQFPHPPPYHGQPQQPQQLQAQSPQSVPPLANAHPLHPTQSPAHPSPLPPAMAAPVGVPQGARFQPPPVPPYGGNGILSSMAGQPLTPFPPHSQPPHVQTPQAQRSIPYSASPSYPPQHPLTAPPLGGVMLPPFQVAPQGPSHPQQAPSYPPVSTPVPRQSHPFTKASSPGSLAARQNLPPLQPLSLHARNAFSTPQGLHTPSASVGTPRSAKSLWKQVVHNTPAALPSRPEVSPIEDLDEEDVPEEAVVKTKVSRRGRSKNKSKENEMDHESEATADPEPEEVPEMETRRGRSRRMGAARRARPESLASSRAGGSVRDRSRSQSVISHTDTTAGETESQADTRVKSERGTSFDVIEEEVATPSHPSTRRRGGTTQTHGRGRKRTAREASLAESEDHAPEPGPAHQRVVIAPRHFSRMCNPIMNDISSHKHASTFTTAVKPKNAEGYYDIIKRPTDLKSIQKAIAAGAKIVGAAATAADTPVNGGSPGAGGGVIELPLSEDVIPPKAIVNSAQLENELMRMFANAVMFNPGEEGVVEDAREMFETCQQSVSNWRSAERSRGKLEAGADTEETPGLAGTEDVADGVVGKRRKVG